MINKSCITKICKDFDLPFTANENNFANILGIYTNSVPAESEELKNVQRANDIFKMMRELDSPLKEYGFGTDILFKLVSDFAYFIRCSITGVYNDNRRSLYNIFNNKDINAEYPLEKINVSTGDVYNINNVGKSYISVDMCKAAFQALRHDSPELLEYQKDWNDYIKYMLTYFVETVKHNPSLVMKSIPTNIDKIVDIEMVKNFISFYLINSRQLRQVIFGNTNASRLCHIEKHIMQKYVYKTIMENYPNAVPVKFCNDELIFEYTPELFAYIKQNLVTDINFKVEAFRIDGMKIVQNYDNNDELLSNEYDGIIIRRRIDTLNSFSFKCCPSTLRYFANRFINGENEIIASKVNPAFITIDVNGFTSRLIGKFTHVMFNKV